MQINRLSLFYSCLFGILILMVSCTNKNDDPTPDAKTVVILGSSTAAGTGLASIDSSWVNKLARRLNMIHSDTRLINLAVPGYTTFHVLPDYYRIKSKPTPDKNHNLSKAFKYNNILTIINLPTNDVANNFTDKETLENYKLLTSLLENKQIPYIIMGSQPRNFADHNQRLRLKELNTKLAELYPGKFCDFYARLCTNNYSIANAYNQGDGIHLNEKGHDVLYKSLLVFPFFR